MVNLAGRNTNESALWLRHQQEIGANWFRQCLILQRKARDIPALAPTAFAAATITPNSERVFNVGNLKRGMVGFSKGTNPAGHVFFILGHKTGMDLQNPDAWLTRSNDVVQGHPGRLGVVPLSFYHEVWHHNFLFGATWLNGYDFADFNKAPVLARATLGSTYEHAIADVKSSIEYHKKKGDDALVALLRRDLAVMERRYKNHQ
jgi:hypothetical protein